MPSPVSPGSGRKDRRQARGQGSPLTNDAAEQAQAGGVSLPAVPWVVHPGGREWDPQPDGPVEFPAPGLHGDDGAERGLIAQELGDKLIWNGLGLRRSEQGTLSPRGSEGLVDRTQLSPQCKGGTQC